MKSRVSRNSGWAWRCMLTAIAVCIAYSGPSFAQSQTAFDPSDTEDTRVSSVEEAEVSDWQLKPEDTRVSHSSQRAVYHQHARQTVDQVLADDEFANLNPDDNQWFQEQFDKLRNLFRSMGNQLDRLPVWVHKTIIAWMILALIAVLAHLVYTLWQSLRRESRLGEVGAGDAAGKGKALEVLGVRELEYEKVLQRARELSAQGDLEASVRYFYAAALLYLDRHGRVRFAPAKTNRDYLLELPMGDPALQPLRSMTRAFEAAIFGRQAVDDHATQVMADGLQEIQQTGDTQHVHLGQPHLGNSDSRGNVR